jgi:serine/threonine protein kinase/WD40 repeat protein
VTKVNHFAKTRVTRPFRAFLGGAVPACFLPYLRTSCARPQVPGKNGKMGVRVSREEEEIEGSDSDFEDGSESASAAAGGPDSTDVMVEEGEERGGSSSGSGGSSSGSSSEERESESSSESATEDPAEPAEEKPATRVLFHGRETRNEGNPAEAAAATGDTQPASQVRRRRTPSNASQTASASAPSAAAPKGGAWMPVVAVFFDARAHAVVVVFSMGISLYPLHRSSVSTFAAGTRASAITFTVGVPLDGDATGSTISDATGEELTGEDGGPKKLLVRFPSRCTAAEFVDGSDGFLSHRAVVPSPKRLKELEDTLPWIVCACAGQAPGGSKETNTRQSKQSVLSTPEVWSPHTGTDGMRPRVNPAHAMILVLRASDGQLLRAMSIFDASKIAAPSSLEESRDHPSGANAPRKKTRAPPSPSKILHRRALANTARLRGPVLLLEWAPDGRLIAACKNGSILIFVLPAGVLCCDTTPVKSRPTAMTFDRVSSCVIVGYDADDVVRVFGVPPRLPQPADASAHVDSRLVEKARLVGHKSRVTGIVATLASPQPHNTGPLRDFSVIVTSSRDGTVRLWSGQSTRELGHEADSRDGDADVSEVCTVAEMCGYKLRGEDLRYDPLRRLFFVADDNGMISVCQMRATGTLSHPKVEAHVIQRLRAHDEPSKRLSFCSFTDTVVSCSVKPSGKTAVGVWPSISAISHAAAVATSNQHQGVVRHHRRTRSGSRHDDKEAPSKDIDFLDAGKFQSVISTRKTLLKFFEVLLPDLGGSSSAELDASRRRTLLMRGFAAIQASLQLELDLTVSVAQAQAQVTGSNSGQALSTMLHRQLQELRGLCGNIEAPPHMSTTKNVLAHYKSISRSHVRKAVDKFRRLQSVMLPVISSTSVSADSSNAPHCYRLGAAFPESTNLGTVRALEEWSGRLVAVKILPAGVEVETGLEHECLVNILDVIEGSELPSEVVAERAFRRACFVDLAEPAEPAEQDDEEPTGNPGACFVVLPMLSEDLGSFVHRRSPGYPFTSRDIAQIMFDLLRGVAYLHSQRMVVRDLRPQQILMTSEGRPRLVHLGVMRPPQGFEPLDQGWSFAAPELFVRVVKGSSDVWALGALMAYLFHSEDARVAAPLFCGEDARSILSSQVAFAGVPSPVEISKMAEECRIDDSGMDLLEFVRDHDWPHPELNRNERAARLMPGAPADAIGLMCEMLRFPTQLRISAVDALEHPFFSSFGLYPTPEEREQRPLTDITATTELDATDAIFSSRSGWPISPTATMGPSLTPVVRSRGSSESDTSADAGDSEFDISGAQSDSDGKSDRGAGSGLESVSVAGSDDGASIPQLAVESAELHDDPPRSLESGSSALALLSPQSEVRRVRGADGVADSDESFGASTFLSAVSTTVPDSGSELSPDPSLG